MQYVDVPGYAALIIRKDYVQLKDEGGLIDISHDLLDKTDAHWSEQDKKWTFPSGASLTFRHLEYERQKYRYQGSAYQFVAFDELTHWSTSKPYTYLFSRLRQPDSACVHCDGKLEWSVDADEYVHKDSGSTCDVAECIPFERAPDGMSLLDVPLRMRAGTNPGGEGHEWVYTRFIEPWEKWKNEEAPVPTRKFVPARLWDNPYLNWDSYVESLSELDDVERDQLLAGDWHVTEIGGMFDPDWFMVVNRDNVPADAKWVRNWDLAATEPNQTNKDPDWTAGALCALHEGTMWIVDMQHFRKHPAEVEEYIGKAAVRDTNQLAKKPPIRMEQEPGASGKLTINTFGRSVLLGYDFDGQPSSKDKEGRAKLWAAPAKRGQIRIVQGDWNKSFLTEARNFPKPGYHDDQIDAVSGAWEYLAGVRKKHRKGRILV